MASDEQNLGVVTLFASLSAAERESLAKRCRWRRYGEGQQVIGHHDTGSDVYFMVIGAARATFFTKAGKQVTFRNVGPGAFFGELSALDDQPRSATIVALSDCLIASMTGEAFRHTLRDHPTVAEALLRYLAGQVRFLTERVIEYSALDVPGRIHAELLRLARDHMTGENTAEVTPVPTHAEIASWVSTHREAVTRELNYLDRAGVLERHAGKLIIRNVAALAERVEKMLGE